MNWFIICCSLTPTDLDRLFLKYCPMLIWLMWTFAVSKFRLSESPIFSDMPICLST